MASVQMFCQADAEDLGAVTMQCACEALAVLQDISSGL